MIIILKHFLIELDISIHIYDNITECIPFDFWKSEFLKVWIKLNWTAAIKLLIGQ